MQKILLSGTLALLALACAAPRVGKAPSGKVAAAHPEVLPFIANDYARAVGEARARGLPLFVEAWAPW